MRVTFSIDQWRGPHLELVPETERDQEQLWIAEERGWLKGYGRDGRTFFHATVFLREASHESHSGTSQTGV